MKSNWQIKKLGEIAEIKGGKRVPRGYKLETTPTKHPYIRVSDFNDIGSIDLTDIRYINEKVFNQIKNYTISANDLYISIAGTIGKSGIVPKELNKANLTENACKLVFKSDIDQKYIYYFTQTEDFLFQAGLNTKKTAMPKLALSRLSTIKLSIPDSSSEQHRIVKILDDTFEKIALAKENAKKNLQNAHKLFDSYLQNVFTNSDKNWEEGKLKNLFQINPPKKMARDKLKANDFVSFLPMKDLQINLKEFTVNKKRKLSDVLKSYTYFANDDVLLAKITPCFENGKLGIARKLINEVGFGSSEYIVFRSNGKSIPDFLYYFLSRDYFRKEGTNRMSGAVGHKRVSKDFIEESIMPYPKSKLEQKTIVRKLDNLWNETKKLEKIYKQKLADLEELKKSVLQKAFNGDL